MSVVKRNKEVTEKNAYESNFSNQEEKMSKLKSDQLDNIIDIRFLNCLSFILFYRINL